METAVDNMKTNDAHMGGGWLARRSMAVKLFLATSAVTFVVMLAITAAMAWQSKIAAVKTVDREMSSALNGVDQSLQAVFSSATRRAQELLPVMERELGGVPVLDGGTANTDEGGEVPLVIVGDRIINGDIDTLLRINENTGALSEVIARSGDKWVRIATLLRDAQDNVRMGSAFEPNDLVARALDGGQLYSGISQRNGKWYAISVKPLKDEAGAVYGGLLIQTDIQDQVSALLQWISTMKVAGPGSLGGLQKSPDGKEWLRLAGADGAAGERLAASTSTADLATLEELYNYPQGFSRVVLGEDANAQFVAWSTVPNWDWLMYGIGEEADFLGESYLALLTQLGLMLLGTLLISLLVGWLAARTIHPVRRVILGMERLGQGDLTSHIATVPAGSKNEVHILLESLGRTQLGLERTITTVRSTVEEINVGASQITSGNTDLSSRTEQQAASLQETAASMDELAATVKQNTDHAQQANALALDASTIAHRGEKAVSEVVQTMNRISDSSGKIGEIVGVIDSIAFQTNILALNAAVEAARAGEQGRGFAVVASEVRSLAQRSADAAREIKKLIDASIAEVNTGAQQVGGAGATMQEVVTSVRRVTEIMNEIAAASEEQSSGIEQVNLAVSQMDEVTQQNAALVEQAAAAAGSLQEQARHLADAVAVFKITSKARSMDLQAEPKEAVRTRSPVDGVLKGLDGPANVAQMTATLNALNAA